LNASHEYRGVTIGAGKDPQNRLGFRSGHWIIVVGVFLAAAVTIGTGYLIERSYSRVMRENHASLRNLATVLSEQTDQALQSLEMAEGALIERIMAADVRRGEDLPQATSGLEWHQMIKERITLMPHVDAIAIIDFHGKLVNFSRAYPVPDVNVSDREYFKALSGQSGLRTFISEPIRSRSTGIWTVYLARRISGPDGEFLGLVLGAMQTAYFQRFYQNIDLPEGGAIALLRRDGVLLARFPHLERTVGMQFPPLDTSPGSEESAGVFRRISVIDGVDRIAAGVHLPNYPAFVAVSHAVPKVLQDWRRESIFIAVTAAVMNLAVAVAGWLGLRQIRASQKLAERESYLARHDMLTGLPNRMLFHENLERALQRSKAEGEGFAVLLLDLDEFKGVNDTLGHHVGDELLRRVTERLSKALGDRDCVARLGGDEFAVIQVGVTNAQQTAILGGQLLRRLAQPFDLERDTVSIGVSIGAVLYPANGTDPVELLKHADLALYRAKSSGRQTFRFYRPEMDEEMQARRSMERDMSRAFEESEFELFYQPLLNLRDQRIVGFEALLRWQHADKGFISPVDFIRVAEETGLIGPLGDWVLLQACREAATWPERIKVAVNLSPCQFRSRDMFNVVSNSLAMSKLDPDRLELEITESVLLEYGEASPILHRIKQLGVSISLDDFGTGYASLSYLRRFPFDKIKIDRSFVEEVDRPSDSQAIVQTTLDLAHRLGMTTTAEGVETREQLEALTKAGCTEAQGYLIGRPMPRAEVKGFLAMHSSRMAVG
jgi:diguanylate cyclase (GGDEF)-like protein